MTTLKELLNLPRFSDLEILSTHKNLNRPVESVEITETPDIANYIPKNAIILTTAMIFDGKQEMLKPFIRSLLTKDVAALGIKVGRFIDEINPDIIEFASQVNLPIIKVPSTQPLGRLLYQMLSYVWDSKTEQLSYALDIQNKFSNLLMNDVTTSRFIAELGNVINAPAILLSPWHKVISHSNYFSGSDHPASFYAEQLSEHDFIKINKEKTSFLVSNLKGEKIQMIAYPVKVGNYFPFHLIILKPEQIPYPISEFAIEQAVLVLTFMLYKNHKVQEFFDILKSDFLEQLVKSKTDQINDNRNWIDLGRNYGLIKSNYYQIALAYCVPSKRSKTQIIYRKEEAEIAKLWLQEQLPIKIKNVAIFKVKSSNETAILFQSDETNLKTILQDTSKLLKDELGINLTFAFGNPYKSIEDISSSFVEAKSTLDESKQLYAPDIVNHYHPKGLIGLFENTREENIHYFCEKILKKLAYPEEPNLRDLKKTLKVYLDYHCEITKTANALYLHRNTIKYRIKQCEKILGMPVKNPKNSLNLRLALELSEFENEAISQ